MRALLLVVTLILAGCIPQEDAPGADVIWQSDDGMERVVQMGPCTKTQTKSKYAEEWYTTYTGCASSTAVP